MKDSINDQKFEYDAFISYSHHSDHEIAKLLQKALHRFAKPWYRLRSLHTFRDETNMGINPQLWPSIESALERSRYFLLFASQDAANSKWVSREVATWIEKRSADKLLIVLTDGELVWDDKTGDFDKDKTTSLPPNLFGILDQEPLYVDLRWARNRPDDLTQQKTKFREAVCCIAATLCGKTPDELDGEDFRQHKKTRMITVFAVVLLSMLTILSVILAVLERKSAQIAKMKAREARINLAEIYAEQGRKEFLTGHPFRATALISEAYRQASDQKSIELMFSLISQFHENQQVVIHIPEKIQSAQISADKKKIAVCNESGFIEIFDLESEKMLSGLPEFSAIDSLVKFNSESNTLVIRNKLGCLQLWDLSSGSIIMEDAEPCEKVTAAKMNLETNILVTCDRNNVLKGWKLSENNRLFMTIEGSRSFDINSKGKYIAVGSGGLRIIDSNIGRIVAGVDVPVNESGVPLIEFYEVLFSPDGNFLFAGGTKGAGLIFHLKENFKESKYFFLKGLDVDIGNASFSPDNSQLATTTWDGKTYLWNVLTGEKLLEWKSHGAGGAEIVFNNNGSLLATYLPKYEPVKVWDKKGRLVWAFDFPPKMIKSAFFSDNSRSMIIITTDGAIRKCIINPRTLALKNEAETFHFTSATLSKEGDFLITGKENGLIDIWEMETGAHILSNKVSDFRILDISSHSSTDVLAVGTLQGLFLAQISKTDQNRLIGDQSAMIWSTNFSPSGKFLVACSLNGKLNIYDTQDYEMINKHNFKGIAYAVFSHDDKKLLVGFSNSAEIWNVANWHREIALESVSESPWILNFSEKAEYAVGGAQNGKLWIWDVQKGSLISAPEGHDSPIRSVNFLPGNKFIVSTGSDGQACFWEVQSGSLIGLYRSSYGNIIESRIDEDDRSILLVTDSGAVHKLSIFTTKENLANRLKKADDFLPWQLKKGSLFPRIIFH